MVTSLLRINTVHTTTGKPTSSIYADMAEETFPSPVEIGANAVAWLESEIDAWKEAIINGASKSDLQALVRELVAARGHKPNQRKKERYRQIARKAQATRSKKQVDSSSAAEAGRQ